MIVNPTTALFERNVLAESSVTGKSKDARPSLDKVSVFRYVDIGQKLNWIYFIEIRD